MLHYADWPIVTNVGRNHNAFTFKISEFQEIGGMEILLSSSNNPRRITLFVLLNLEDETSFIIYQST